MLEGLRGAALLVPDAVGDMPVPALSWQRYGQIDQASYDFVDDVTLPMMNARGRSLT